MRQSCLIFRDFYLLMKQLSIFDQTAGELAEIQP